MSELVVHLKRRPFIARLWRSYRGWRDFGLSRLEALEAAFKIART